MFLGVGLPAIVVGVVAWFYLADSPAKAKWLDADEKEWLTGELTAEDASKTSGHEKHPASASVFSNGRVWMLSFIYFGFIYGLYTLAFFLPDDHRAGSRRSTASTFDYFQKGLITAIPYLPAAIVALLRHTATPRSTASSLAHRHPGARRRGQHPARPLRRLARRSTIAVITVTACAIFSALPNFWTVPTQFLTGAAAAAGIALINTMGNMAGFTRSVHHRLAEGLDRRLQGVRCSSSAASCSSRRS